MLRTGMRSGTLLKVGAIVCVLFATDMLLGLLREREIANARADMKHIRAQIFDTKAKRKQTLETIADLKHTLSELNADVSALHAQHAQVWAPRMSHPSQKHPSCTVHANSHANGLLSSPDPARAP